MAFTAPTSDIKRAYEILKAKEMKYTPLFAYAEGNQPVRYSTDRLREAFDSINVRFSQNWCSVVIDSVAERLSIKGWDVEDDSVNDLLDELWNSLKVHIEADDAHWAALVTSEAYIIVWQNDEGAIDLYYNDPRICHVFYNPERPKETEFACKWFADANDVYHMTLYYPDRLEYYVARQAGKPSSHKSFELVDTATNPFSRIPVFHLRKNRRGTGELANILTLQDAVNKLLADMLVTAEYSAFKQRWIISNADTTDLRNAPNEIWSIPAGDGISQATTVGQFDSTDLDIYLKAIDKLATSIAIISRTPKHYFFSQGGDPSGEALIAMEAPLNKKALKNQENFGIVWQEIALFILELQGITMKLDDIIVVWERVESIQPKTESEIIETLTKAGIPLVTVLRRIGWSEQDIAQMEKDMEAVEAKRATIAQAMLDQMRLEDAQSNDEEIEE